MKKLAEKGGFIWFILGVLPSAFIIFIIGNIINLESKTIVLIQLPFLIVQIFSLILMIIYPKQILE